MEERIVIAPLHMPFSIPLVLHFWASPENTMAAIANMGSMRTERNAASLKVLIPVCLPDDSDEAPKPGPRPEFPTDVPVPEPHDVPIPEPIDPPVPDPGKEPPSKKPKAPGSDPKPRSAP
jgi:hypothetical protein